MADQVPKEVVQERYDRLIALQERISLEENQKLIGSEVELLVANGEGRKDADTRRLSGRARDSRLVHFELPEGSETPRPGDVVTVRITQAAPHHLIADAVDGAPLRVRRTRAGDAWDRDQADSCAVPTHGTTGAAGAGAGRVSLGLPTLRVREPLTSPGVGTMPIYDPTDGQR
jgi:tRNA-2-methylthio-N6-dimethylallyladenosine synthase